MSSDDKPIDRRRFFRQGLRELFKPLASGLENIERITQELGKLEDYAPSREKLPPPTSPAHWLRPPGALEENAFRETCSKCGICVSVCPAHCIKLDSLGVKGNGAPYIEPSEMPCVICDSLACMHNCPSGALLPTPTAEIDMGTAEWDPHTCLRTHDDPCQICVDQCPMGTAALELKGTQIVVHPDGCSGCGVCEKHCPTTPKSIMVLPRSAR
jgi:ferredoxin-type protein NapG